MKSPLRIAASHFSVSGSIVRNSRYIKSQMKEAAEKGVQLIHFPETALTGWGMD
jgi:predicted amidohydrolase